MPNKFNLSFRTKDTTEYCNIDETLADTKDCLSDTTEMM